MIDKIESKDNNANIKKANLNVMKIIKYLDIDKYVFADSINRSTSLLDQIESGNRNVTFDFARRIRRAYKNYNFNINYILGNSDEMFTVAKGVIDDVGKLFENFTIVKRYPINGKSEDILVFSMKQSLYDFLVAVCYAKNDELNPHSVCFDTAIKELEQNFLQESTNSAVIDCVLLPSNRNIKIAEENKYSRDHFASLWQILDDTYDIDNCESVNDSSSTPAKVKNIKIFKSSLKNIDK